MIFETDPGDVEDANVGDKALGDIGDGSRVAVLGEHVYDGFHLPSRGRQMRLDSAPHRLMRRVPPVGCSGGEPHGG